MNVVTAAARTAHLPLAPRTRRGTELFLLLFAFVLVAGAYINVSFALHGDIEVDGLPAIGGVVGLYLGAHILIRKVAKHADPLLLPIAALLNGLGLVMIYRIHAALPKESPTAGTQLLWTAVAMVAFAVTLLVVRDHTVLQRYRYIAMLVGLLLLVLPALVGTDINGAQIWVRVGGLSIQPAEIAKLLLMVFFASYFVAKRDVLALASRRVLGVDLPRARDLGPVAIAWLVSLAVLIFEKDLGTSLMFFGIFIVMLYVATERTSWVLIGCALFAAGAFAAYKLFSHVALRVDVWLHPFSTDQRIVDHSYQLRQAMFGMASGGVPGTGLGQGHPDIVPYAYSDFILSSIGEELGLAGFMAIIVLFALIAERGLRTALSVRDGFGKLLAMGLAFSMTWQLFIVAGGVTRLIPLTGLTTPFMSYGGSSLLANWVIIALLLRISDAARRPMIAAAKQPLPAPMLVDAPTQVVRR
ncbi:MAG: cell division protein [Frankiales bacterium]|nr:cell division protein [Frankiales bacterium]